MLKHIPPLTSEKLYNDFLKFSVTNIPVVFQMYYANLVVIFVDNTIYLVLIEIILQEQ